MVKEIQEAQNLDLESAIQHIVLKITENEKQNLPQKESIDLDWLLQNHTKLEKQLNL